MVLLAALAGLFAMHGMSDHGTAGPSDLVSAHAAHLSMPMPVAEHDVAHTPAGPAVRSDSPYPPMGGHDMGLAGLCLAVLVVVLVLSSALQTRLRSSVLTGLTAWSARNAGVARARAPSPPDLFALSIQRC